MIFPHLNWNIRLLSSVFTCLLFPYFYLLLRSSRFLSLPFKPFVPPLCLFIYISVFLTFFLCQSFLPPFLTYTFLWFFFLSVILLVICEWIPLLTFNPRSSRGLNPNPFCLPSNWDWLPRFFFVILFPNLFVVKSHPWNANAWNLENQNYRDSYPQEVL